MEIVVLVGVVGANDVGIIEGRNGTSFEVEAFKNCGFSAMLVGSTLTAARRRIYLLCSQR